MAIGSDRIQVLIYESAAKGGDPADDTMGIPTEISPQEDVLESAGIYLQDALNRDENVYIDRDGDDLRFRDVNNPSPITLTTLASASAPTLDSVINAGTPDNDVIIPSTNTIIWRDNGLGITPLSIVKTSSAASGISVTIPISSGAGITVTDGGTNVTNLTPAGLRQSSGTLTLTSSVLSGAITVTAGTSNSAAVAGQTTVQGGTNTSTGVGGNVTVAGGSSTSGNGGSVTIRAGTGGTVSGGINIGTTSTSFIVIGSTSVVPNIQLSGGDIDLRANSVLDGTVYKTRGFKLVDPLTNVDEAHFISCQGNPDGQVTEPQGAFAVDPLTPAFYQNQDGGTTWRNISRDRRAATYIVGSAAAGDTAPDVDFLDTGDGQAIVDALTAAAANAGRVYIKAGVYDFATGSAGSSLPIASLAGCLIDGEGNSTDIRLDSINRQLISNASGTTIRNLQITAPAPSPGATGTCILSLGFGSVQDCTFNGAGTNVNESIVHVIELAFGQVRVEGCTFSNVPTGSGDGWAIGFTTNRSNCSIRGNVMTLGKGFVRNLTQSLVAFNDLVQVAGASTGTISGTNECIFVDNKILPFGTTTPQFSIAGIRNVISRNIVSGIFNATTYGISSTASNSVFTDNAFQNVFFTNGDGIRLVSGSGNIITGNRLVGLANAINQLTTSSYNVIRNNDVPYGIPGSRVRLVTAGLAQPVLASDETIIMDATSGTVSMTMPLAASFPGFIVAFRRGQGTGGGATSALIQRQGSDLIDGATFSYISGTAVGNLYVYRSDGVSNWYRES